MPISCSRVLITPLVLAALLLVAGLAGCNAHAQKPAGHQAAVPQLDQAAAGQVPRYPSSMDALGGSVSLGFNTGCPDPWLDCPENSWATGTNPQVDSVYLRLVALNPQLRGNTFNDAASGTTMADLDAQAHRAVQRRAEL